MLKHVLTCRGHHLFPLDQGLPLFWLGAMRPVAFLQSARVCFYRRSFTTVGLTTLEFLLRGCSQSALVECDKELGDCMVQQFPSRKWHLMQDQIALSSRPSWRHDGT